MNAEALLALIADLYTTGQRLQLQVQQLQAKITELEAEDVRS